MSRDEPFRCPQCGSQNCDRVEVDIGVGIQYGPWGCFECGWSQSAVEIPIDQMLDDNIFSERAKRAEQ